MPQQTGWQTHMRIRADVRLSTLLIAAAAASPLVAIHAVGAQTGPPVAVATRVNAGYDWNGWYARGHGGYRRGTARSGLFGPNLIGSGNAVCSPQGGPGFRYDH